MSGASERGNGGANGPVPTSRVHFIVSLPTDVRPSEEGAVTMEEKPESRDADENGRDETELQSDGKATIFSLENVSAKYD